MRWIDLTMTIRTGMPVWPGHAHTCIYTATSHEGMRSLGLKMSFQTEGLLASTHEGTHVDAPFHSNPNGKPLDALDVTDFTGSGLCLDVSAVPAERRITAADLQEALSRSGLELQPGDHLLLYTGHWERHYGTRFWLRHTGLDATAADWLAARGLHSVGIDAPSIDSSEEMKLGEYPAHRILNGEQSVLIVENLVNLAAVAGRRFTYYGWPIKLANASGAPLRAVAALDDPG